MSEDRRENQNLEVEEVSEEQLSEQRQVRREKLKNLQDADRNQYLLKKGNFRQKARIIKITF